MHRHGYQGRKLHRERDERRALIKGLADSLIKYESIETTLPKAKEVVPYVEGTGAVQACILGVAKCVRKTFRIRRRSESSGDICSECAP